jgi:hypothetical protein
MNPGSQGGRIAISSADEDSAMPARHPVQVDEIATVECQYGPTLARGEGKDVGTFDPLVSPASFLDREDIVAKRPQLDNDLKGEILVSIESGHPSCVLILADGPVDLLGVLVVIGPGRLEIDLGQVGMTIEDFVIGKP